VLGGQPRLDQHSLAGDVHHPPGPAGGRPEQFPSTTNGCDNAGTAPITRASGKSRVVLAHARNCRLADATYQWAFAASPAHPERGSSTTTSQPEEQPTTPRYAP